MYAGSADVDVTLVEGVDPGDGPSSGPDDPHAVKHKIITSGPAGLSLCIVMIGRYYHLEVFWLSARTVTIS
jgi:hypothetical protein